VCFCDEIQINLVYSCGNGYVWRRIGEELNEENVRGTVEHADVGVMVGASIAITMPGTIHFIEGKLFGEGYRDLLRDVMLPNARQLLGSNFYFLDDNDRSVVVKNFIRTHSIRRMNFPPQSPDLNPVENFWSKLKLQVSNRNLKTSKN